MPPYASTFTDRHTMHTQSAILTFITVDYFGLFFTFYIGKLLTVLSCIWFLLLQFLFMRFIPMFVYICYCRVFHHMHTHTFTCMHTSQFIHSLYHRGTLEFAAINILVHISRCRHVPISRWYILPGSKNVGHKWMLNLIKNCQFSKMVSVIYISISSEWEFQLSLWTFSLSVLVLFCFVFIHVDGYVVSHGGFNLLYLMTN